MATETITWEPPGPGFWLHDPSHAPGAPTPLFHRFNADAMKVGMASMLEEFGGPLATMEAKFVNGKYYRRLVPLVGANRDMPPPPAAAVWLLSRLHPEFRRRNRNALATFGQKLWAQRLEEWQDVLRPQWRARNLALQAVDVSALDDAGLAAHLRTTFDTTYEGHVLHFALHGIDLGPIGDLLAHTKAWGIPDLDVVAALEGASPASAAAAAAVRAVAVAVEAAGVKPASLAEVRSASPAAAAALDAYLDEYGWRIVTSYDVDGRTLTELPEAVLACVVAAMGVERDSGGEARADKAAASVRARVPEAERTAFDDLLADGRRVYGLRDDNGPLTAEWPIGLLRRGLLEAGRRLAGRGALAEADHALELEIDEVTGLLTGATTPTAADVSARAATRAMQAGLDAPMELGKDTGAPPLSAMPAGLRRATAAVLAAVAVIEPPPEARRPLCGTGIGRESYKGRARVASRPEDVLAAMEPGDVLVATFTTPAYNTILSVAGAIVVEEGGALCHAAVMARELDIPAVVGALGAMTSIPDGAMVEVDPTAGTVRVL